jgi:hypothetical protein
VGIFLKVRSPPVKMPRAPPGPSVIYSAFLKYGSASLRSVKFLAYGAPLGCSGGPKALPIVEYANPERDLLYPRETYWILFFRRGASPPEPLETKGLRAYNILKIAGGPKALGTNRRDRAEGP